MRDNTDGLMARWETWPLWALGLSNGLNIVLWYVLSMARINSPELPITVLSTLAAWLPFIVVIGGVAQALSLDGALIATIAGARLGRYGWWTWLTIAGACLFSAAISYAVHSGRIDQLPILHVASAVILGLYNAHLAQPRKPLHTADQRQMNGDVPLVSQKPRPALPASASPVTDIVTARSRRCSRCGMEQVWTLTDVRRHQQTDECKVAN